MNKQIMRTIRSSAILQMRQSFSRSMFKFTTIVSPIFFGLILGFVYSGKTPEEFVSYVMIGTATMTMWSSISFSSAGDIARERYMGALMQIFNSPQSFYHIMLGKIIGNTVLGMLSMIFSFAFVSIIFNVPLMIQSPVAFIIVFIMAVLSYSMIALMLSGLLAVSRQTRTLMNCMDYPVFILTGCIFPVSILPPVVRSLSYLLSPTYAIRLLRLSVWGGVMTSEFLFYSIGLAIITIVYGILSIKIYQLIEVKARKDATLEVI